MRDILGFRNPESKLFPELLNLIKENEYHVIKRENIDYIYYSNPKLNRHYNLASTVEETVIILPQQNRIHYSFTRGSGETDEPIIIEKISCEELSRIGEENGINYEEYDINNPEEVLQHKEGNRSFYKICKQLEKNKIYRLKVITKYPPCMSDLKISDKKSRNFDDIEYNFIMPTHSAILYIYFPFKLREYDFHIKRFNLSRTYFRILSQKNKEVLLFDYKTNKIKVFQENFQMGDVLKIVYSKKKESI